MRSSSDRPAEGEPVPDSGATNEALMTFRRKALFWAIGRIPSEDIADAATSALVDGVDSPTLALLAGLTPREAVEQVPELLPRALSELGMPIPPRDSDEAKVEAACEFAHKLVKGDLAPREAAGTIYKLFLPGYPDEVYPFLLLHDEYSLIGQYTRRSEAQIDAAVIDAAREFLSETHNPMTREEMWTRWRPTG